MYVDKLQIESLRGLTALDLPLAPITLIAGITGIGKTTVLEAIGLALRPTDPGQWISTAMRRDSSLHIVEGLMALFALDPAGQPAPELKVGAVFNGGVQRKVRVSPGNFQGEAASLCLTINVDGVDSSICFPSLETSARLSTIENSLTVHTLGPTPRRKTCVDNMRWLMRQPPAYHACVQRILQCVDPDLQDIRLQWPRVQLLQRDRWVDLAVVGEGTARTLELALTVVRAARGVLLIDGLEHSLHHTVTTKLVATLLSIADTLAIQLIATTDDLSVVDAALDAVEEVSLDAVEEASPSTPLVLHYLMHGAVRTYGQAQLGRLRERGLHVC